MDGDLQNQFFSAMMRIKKMGAMFFSECEIQMNELAVLQAIAGGCECDGCGSMNLNVPEIQKRLHISKPAVTYILNALEKKDFIVRGIDPRDRRKISITATPAGKLAASKSIEKYDEMWGELVGRFGEDNMRELLALLGGLMDACGQMQCGETPPE